jgi:hypothetical protein
MYRNSFLILFFFFGTSFSFAQGSLAFIGHALYNEKPLTNSDIKVYESGKEIQKLSTVALSDFKVILPLGKNYRVYFENAKAQRMYMEIITDNIPANKLSYKMTYELEIPFFPKDSKMLDTTQFRRPFHKVIYDGKNGMKDDTLYMNAFLAKVQIKKKDELEKEVKTETAVKWTNLAGKLNYDNPDHIPVIAKKVNLLNAQGQVVKTTTTNKFGTFIFTGVNLNEAGKVELDFNK